MTGGITFQFSALTLQAAMDTALERWRLFIDDHEAELPWSTHLIVTEEERADDGSEFDVECRIEFDRKLLETQAVGS
jgi:hypothetical protein